VTPRLGERKARRRRRYVAITGPAGAGKTTLGQILHEALAWVLYPEEEVAKENRFFLDAYTDFERWGFHSQVDFLTASAERHAVLQAQLDARWSGPDVIVEDRTPFEHSGVYVPALAALGRLEPREVELLGRLAQLVEPGYVVPDLLVARRLDQRRLTERVARRNRAGEQLDAGLLSALEDAFDHFLSAWTMSPVLVLGPDTDVLMAGQADGIVSLVASTLEHICPASAKSRSGALNLTVE
jgi:deoxyadenosine/deoxycytidine kinase